MRSCCRGDPGVGKTSLLDLAAALAADSGIRPLRATGSQFEADISYAALHQILHPCLGEVSHLSPQLAGALNVALGLGEGPPPAQLLVASALLALLQQEAKEQPLLLVVDDLPWLDRASALVLGIVARRLAGLPVALLAACRTGEPSFFDQGNLPVTRVAPLSEEAAAELLASRYPLMTSRVRRRLLDTALGTRSRCSNSPSLSATWPTSSPEPSPWHCPSAADCTTSSPPASKRFPRPSTNS